jgi:hypothetical protein
MAPSFLHRTRPHRRWLPFVAGVVLPTVTEGQAALRVSVSDAVASAPIAGASVALRLSRVGGLTDSLGTITIQVSYSGRDTLQVRFPGYAAATLLVELRAGETSEVAVALQREVVTLPKVTVTETRVTREPGVGFNRRQKIGLGHFITRSDIERFAPANSSDILRRVPGVRITPNRAGDHVISMVRSATTRCRVQYYVDNMPMPTEDLLDAAIEQRIIVDAAQSGNDAAGQARARSRKLNRDLPAFTIDQIPPETIEAIEVYRGVAEIPIEYRTAGSVCGVVLIWTKTGA